MLNIGEDMTVELTKKKARARGRDVTSQQKRAKIGADASLYLFTNKYFVLQLYIFYHGRYKRIALKLR